jgi:hypothetical protein
VIAFAVLTTSPVLTIGGNWALIGCPYCPAPSVYYNRFMVPPAEGLPLKDACPWLRDNAKRHEQILDVIERDSVIEGLPPLQPQTRQRILQQLSAIAALGPKPAE